MEMKEETKNIFIVGTVLIVAIAFLAVSLKINPVEPGVNTEEFGKFSNVEEIKSFLKENSGSSSLYGMERSFAATDVAMPEANAAGEAAAKSEGRAASEYSQTNVQVEGVDEPDIVKNDGKYIYTVAGKKIVIVDAFPAEGMKIIEEIEFDDSIRNIFLNENKLIVFTEHYEYVDTGIMCGEFYSFGVRCGGYSKEETKVYIYDVSDKNDPQLDKEIDLSGNYADARMIDNYVYLISSKYLSLNYFDLPYYAVDGVEKKIEASEVYYFNSPDENFVFNTIAAIDVTDGEMETETYLTGAGSTIYVSEDNIYLTYQKRLSQKYVIDRYLDEVLLPALPDSVANEIEDAWEDEDKTDSEKEREIGDILEEYISGLEPNEMAEFQNELDEKAMTFFEEIQKEQEKTAIHKINVNGLEIKHESVGEVPGSVLNQFSMDEFDGNFRIATTTGGWNRERNYNNLYVLDENLKVIGKVEDLAKGERIYSVRFLGERAYMVTFRQTDPLFAIDLSNPENPKVLGELKVTGYSGYLHPYDAEHLIGIGMEATEQGRVQGVKISLFDVSDIENPEEIGKYEVSEKWSNSEATYDHKAVLFDKERNLLVIPVSYSKETAVAGEMWPRYEYWQGAYVFDIDLGGIDLRGKISHEVDSGNDAYWYNTAYVRRSLFMDDVLYTISDKKIKANELDNLAEIKEVELPYSYDDGPVYAAGGAMVE